MITKIKHIDFPEPGTTDGEPSCIRNLMPEDGCTTDCTGFKKRPAK